MRAQWLALLVAAVGLLSPRVGAAQEASERVNVGLLPVVVHSTQAEHDYLSQALADMLSARLEQSGQIAVVRVAVEPTTDATAAIEAGRGAGVEYVVFGSFTQFGDGASLDVRCAPVAPPETAGESVGLGDPGRRIFVSSGTLAEIIPKLDELSAKVSRYLVGAPTASAAEFPPGDAAGRAPRNSDLDDLRLRVDALERAVFYGDGGEATPGEAAEGAEAAPAPAEAAEGAP